MNLKEAITFASLIEAYGTSEGVTKAWDTRGRGRLTEHAPGVIRPRGKDIPVAYSKPERESYRYTRFTDPRPKSGAQEMQQWKQTYTAKTEEGTTIKNGDTVKLKAPLMLWNQKTGENDTLPVGAKVTVVNVLPKIGVGDQMISVNTSKHDTDYIAAKDVGLHKVLEEKIDVQPVPKSQVEQSYTSNDGAQVTIIKTPETRDYNPRTIQDLASQPSRYKGEFQMIEKVAGADGQTTRVYDTSKVPSERWGKEGPSTAAPRPGATVWIHRYEDHVTVQEQPYQRWGMKAKGMTEWKYNNVGKAMGMMKKRYGISVPLSKERF